jgi:UDP-2,3-diacylglucosamine hydrolase
MPDAIIFSDAHASEDDPRGAERLVSFLSGQCPSARRVFILGDLFDFWFGPKQAALAPYSRILDGLKALAEGGVAVTLYHGNRDFYVDERLAAKYRFRLVRDYSVETLCGRRVLLCHGDMLCTNDVRYHRMKAVLRHPLTEAVLTRLPAAIARKLARASRRRSEKEVAAKAQWVLGIDDKAVLEEFAKGAEVIVSGHTHARGERTFDTPQGRRMLYTLGDFGRDGSYLECGDGAFTFRAAPG